MGQCKVCCVSILDPIHLCGRCGEKALTLPQPVFLEVTLLVRDKAKAGAQVFPLLNLSCAPDERGPLVPLSHGTCPNVITGMNSRGAVRV